MSDVTEAINAMLEYSLGDVYTAIPGLVVGVDWANGFVDVKPITSAKDQEGNYFERPVIASVPLMFPSSDDSAITFPVKEGSTVLLVFSMRGMDVFKTNGGSETTDFRMHDVRDAVAIPGLYPRNKSRTSFNQDPNSLTILHNLNGVLTRFEMKDNGDVQVDTPTKFIVNAPIIELNGEVEASSTITAGGTVTCPEAEINDITFTAHVHRWTDVGGGTYFTTVPED